ncbi:30S ribosomal protein S16 [Desulfobacterota bacterium M19]
MAVRIRLSRLGRKKKPFYRIVVQNSEASRNGKFLEIVGTYDPLKSPAAVNIQYDKVASWMARGALPTATVKSLFKAHPAPAAAE